MVADISDRPALTFSDDLTTEESGKSLPVIHCRECGATGWGSLRRKQNDQQLDGDLRSFYTAFFNRNPLTAFVFPARDNEKHEEKERIERKLCQDCLRLNISKATYCHGCNNENLLSVVEPNIVIEKNSKNGFKWRESSHDCPFCQIHRSQADDLTTPGLRLATMHRVKGLQFEYVLLASLTKDELPPKRILDCLSDNRARLSLIERDRCLLHVAATRAKKEVMVTYHGQPSKLIER